MLAGMKSEQVAGFVSESMAGFIGIRNKTAITTKMVRLRGRSPCGKRLRAAAPFGHWCAQSFIAGLRCHGLTAPWIVDKATDRVAFARRQTG
jgi:hypothetical protein